MLPLMCLATAIFFEARGESYDGKLAVGQVILNRTESEEYPDSICAVIDQKSQFSYTEDGKSDNPLDYLENEKDIESFIDSISAATEVLSGTNDIEISSTHYHAVSVSPGWSQKLKMDGRIGNHIFYTDVS